MVSRGDRVPLAEEGARIYSHTSQLSTVTDHIQSLRIDEGCIACNLCEDLAPQVFEVPIGADCRVKAGSLVRISEDEELRRQVHEAAESCPVEVILVNEDE